jgi:hypothetical protein
MTPAAAPAATSCRAACTLLSVGSTAGSTAQVLGSLTLSQSGGTTTTGGAAVRIAGTLSHLPTPGKHGLAVHQYGDLSSSGGGGPSTSSSSTGGIFNPFGKRGCLCTVGRRPFEKEKRKCRFFLLSREQPWQSGSTWAGVPRFSFCLAITRLVHFRQCATLFSFSSHLCHYVYLVRRQNARRAHR